MFTKFNNDKVVECTKTSKGQTFVGRAECSSTDLNNPIIGEKLAHYRCEQQIQKQNLFEIRRAKELLKMVMEKLPPKETKLYMAWYQEACNREKAQLHRIKVIKDRIKSLSNGVIPY